MTKFRKSLLIFGLLALIIGAALGTFIVLSVIGSIKSELIELEFTVEDAEQEYNGEALKANSYFISDGRLIEGHTPLVNFKGEQIDVGTGYSSLDVKIVDEKGYDVTNEYSIKVNEGLLKVTQYHISIKLNDREIIYDGATFSVTQDDYDVIGGILPQGHRVSLNIKDEWAENVNSWKNGSKSLTAKDVDIMIFDSNGRNVSKNYVSDLSGSVRLIKRPITLSPLSAEKVYDGRELTCSQYSISKGSLATGHYLEPIFKGVNGETATVKYANEDNPLTVLVDAQIYDNDGNNVTQFYDIQSQSASLTVRRANLTIVAKSASQEYDGKVFTLADDNEPEYYSGLADGDKVTVEYSGAVVGIGKAKNEITKHTVSNDGNNNYNVTYQSGVLEVTKANATVTLKDSVKEYDGKPFYKEGANSAQADSGHISDFYSVQLPYGFSVGECELDGILEEAELCNTTYSLKTFTISDFDGNDVTDCFNITAKSAVCKITRCAVNLTQTETTLTKEYDGNFTFSSGIGFDKVVSGHTFKSVTVLPFTPKDGLTQSVGVVSFSLVDGVGRDAIGYYDIKNLNSFKADVSITQKELTISTLDYNKEYDGIAVGGDLTYGLLAPTDRLVVTKPVSEVNFTGEEEKENKPEFNIYNNNNEIVTGFYKLYEYYGKIKISKKSLLVSLEYCEIEYSGVSLGTTYLFNKIRCDAINPDNFVLTYVTETVNVGEKTVAIDWKADSDDIKQNYSVSYGNLKFDIVKRKLVCPINTAAAQKYYDAQPLIMANMTNNLIDTSGLDDEINLNNFTCTSSSILGEVNVYNYQATLVYESETHQITATGTYSIIKSRVQITSRKTQEKAYDGKPFALNTDELVVKILGTEIVLSSLKVRDYSANEVTDVSSTPQVVSITNATIVFASTGEAVSDANVEYAPSAVAVMINPKQLNLWIDSTKFVQGVDRYNPNSVVVVEGLAEGQRIVYKEDAVVTKFGSMAYFEVYDGENNEYNFTIYDSNDRDVTAYYIIDKQALN